MAIVYISHFLEEVRRVAAAIHGPARRADGRCGAMEETDLATIIAQMVGRDLTELFPNVPHEPGEPVLEIDRPGAATRCRGAPT